jgi:hypothetical protein
MAVCHNYTTSILPFSISSSTRLRPVIHTAGVLVVERPSVAPGESAVPDRGWEAYVRRVSDRA